jgi:protein arginine kinase activator
MQCNICGKNQATVHLTEIVDNQMNELHLCEECARQKSAQMEQQFGLSDLLAGMADMGKTAKESENVTLKCPTCGLSYADFKKIGRLGCSDCYAAFKKYLAPLLKRIHGSSVHLGKTPLKGTQPAVKEEQQMKPDAGDLRVKLQKAIEAEAFEEAARLRDQIKAMEKNGEQG